MTLQNFTLGTFSQGAAGGGGAFESIASMTGNGSAFTLTFSSIPSTYQHLQIRAILKQDHNSSALTDFKIYFNGVNTGTGYAHHRLRGDGATATAAGSSSTTEIGIASPVPKNSAAYSNMMGAMVLDIHDYASTTKNKTVRAFSGVDVNGAGQVILSSGLWANTSAITSISFLIDSYAWTTTTQFALYGIKGA